MDASDVVLAQWSQQVKHIWSELHQYQQQGIALAILGIVLAGNAVMQRVAEVLQERLSGWCKVSSYERRLQRLIANERLSVSDCWHRFLEHSLPFWQQRQVTLVLDCTPYHQQFTMVFVGLLVQRRLLPLAWELTPQTESWDERLWPIVERLFAQVAAHLHSPDVTLLADRGLSSLALIRLCQRHQWHYLLRIKQDECYRRRWRHCYRDWQRGGDFLLKKGTHWFGEVLVWKEHAHSCFLSACWDPQFQEAWFLLSDRPAGLGMVSRYALRMRVEATFQDTKSRRWCIESSRFSQEAHLNRWLLIIFVAFWWTTHLGASCKHQGQAKLFDRQDRYDKSLLRLGHLWIKEVLKRSNAAMRQQSLVEAPRMRNCLPFHRTAHGLRFSICLH